MRNLSEYIRGVPGRSEDIRKLFAKKNLYPTQSSKMLENSHYLFFRDGGNVRSAHYDSLMGRLIVMNCEEVFLDDAIFKFNIGDSVVIKDADPDEPFFYRKVLKVTEKTVDDNGKPTYFLDYYAMPFQEEDLVLYIPKNKKDEHILPKRP